MSSVQENTQVTLLLNGQPTNFSWVELASQLTKYECDGGTCATEIATTGSLDIFWLIFGAVLVFLMQAGFTLLEVGGVHIKNTKHILTKNLGDVIIGALCFYTFGYGFAMVDGNGFIGDSGFALKGDHFMSSTEEGKTFEGYNYAFWLFQWAFAATAATIVSGAVAERVTFVAYCSYSFALTIFIYPVVAHWGWSGTGWASAFADDKLFSVGVIDFAGSGVVHMTGGMAALVGATVIGPRLGRFDENGLPTEMPRQSVAFQTLGTLLLWFGWYGFNCVSTLTLAGNGSTVAAKVAVTTTLSAAMGGLTAVVLGKLFGGKSIDPSIANNGILGGLVGITAGCSTVEPEGAIIIGFVSGIVYFFGSQLLLKLHVDDVVDAVPVHLFCGIWGVMAVALFATEDNYKVAYGDFGEDTPCGLFYSCNGNSGKQFAANLVFVLSIIAWVGGLSAILFIALKKLNYLRVDGDIEELGMDESEHGGAEYMHKASLSRQPTQPLCEDDGNFTNVHVSKASTPVSVDYMAPTSPEDSNINSIASIG